MIQIFLSFQLPWSCHRIYAKLQPASDHRGRLELRKQINPGAFWSNSDFHCVWALTTYIMFAFSNKSVISWPQKYATDASYRKTAATKRGCVSSYHQKIHRPKQMWTTMMSHCLPQQRKQVWFRGEMMQSTALQIRNIPARPPIATKD